MVVAKVVNKNRYITCDKFEFIIRGRCEKCRGQVVMHAKGFDEICPKCEALLDWESDLADNENTDERG